MLLFENLLSDENKWYHYTKPEIAQKILKEGFKKIPNPNLHYGYGIYFTNRFDFKKDGLDVFEFDGKGLNIFDAGKNYFETVRELIRDNYDADELAIEIMGYSGYDLDQDGWKVWNKMDEIANMLGYDAFILRDSFSIFHDILIVYNVDKLNELLKVEKIKLI